MGGPELSAKTPDSQLLFHQREFHWLIQKTQPNLNHRSNPCSEALSGCSQPIEGNLSAPSSVPQSQPGPISPLPAFPFHPSYTLAPHSHTPAPTCQPPPSEFHVLRATSVPLHPWHLALTNGPKLLSFPSSSSNPAPVMLPQRAFGWSFPLRADGQELSEVTPSTLCLACRQQTAGSLV